MLTAIRRAARVNHPHCNKRRRRHLGKGKAALLPRRGYGKGLSPSHRLGRQQRALPEARRRTVDKASKQPRTTNLTSSDSTTAMDSICSNGTSHCCPTVPNGQKSLAPLPSRETEPRTLPSRLRMAATAYSRPLLVCSQTKALGYLQAKAEKQERRAALQIRIMRFRRKVEISPLLLASDNIQPHQSTRSRPLGQACKSRMKMTSPTGRAVHWTVLR